MLFGASAMRPLMPNSGDDARLVIRPAIGLNAGGLAGRRSTPVGGDEKRAFRFIAGCRGNAREPGSETVGGDARLRLEADRGRGQCRIEEGAIEMAVLDHIGRSLAVMIILAEMEKGGTGGRTRL